MVCANPPLKDGSKSNWIDRRKLAALLTTFHTAVAGKAIATTSQYTQIQYERFR